MPYKYNPFTKEINRTGTDVSGEDVGNVTVLNDTPTPATDGLQTVFTVANAYIAGSLVVLLDGLQQIDTADYSETSSTTFTMSVAPATDEVLWVHYIKA